MVVVLVVLGDAVELLERFLCVGAEADDSALEAACEVDCLVHVILLILSGVNAFWARNRFPVMGLMRFSDVFVFLGVSSTSDNICYVKLR